MSIILFHGEGILFSTLLHALFVVGAVSAFVYGLRRYHSMAGVYAALAYLLIALVAGTRLAGGGRAAALFAAVVTAPWNLLVPCYNLDDSCPLRPGVYLVCALLNAALVYFVAARLWRSD